MQGMARLRDEHGIGYFGVSMSFGHMEHSKVMRSMELFVKEVMPKFGYRRLRSCSRGLGAAEVLWDQVGLRHSEMWSKRKRQVT